jgi:hypothetical protein
MIKRTLFLLAFSTILVPNSLQAETLNLPSSLTFTWTQFQNAIKNDNINQLAKITKFPLTSNESWGNMKSAKELKKNYKAIFTPAIKQCLLSSTPEKTKGENGKYYYTVLCTDKYPLDFTLEKVGSKYLFTDIDNINGQ